MRLETYLNALCIAHFRMVEADLDQIALPGRENLYPRSERQYDKFRQHILDCAIWYQNKEVPYYIHEMASLIKKEPKRGKKIK